MNVVHDDRDTAQGEQDRGQYRDVKHEPQKAAEVGQQQSQSDRDNRTFRHPCIPDPLNNQGSYWLRRQLVNWSLAPPVASGSG